MENNNKIAVKMDNKWGKKSEKEILGIILADFSDLIQSFCAVIFTSSHLITNKGWFSLAHKHTLT